MFSIWECTQPQTTNTKRDYRHQLTQDKITNTKPQPGYLMPKMAFSLMTNFQSGCVISDMKFSLSKSILAREICAQKPYKHMTNTTTTTCDAGAHAYLAVQRHGRVKVPAVRDGALLVVTLNLHRHTGSTRFSHSHRFVVAFHGRDTTKDQHASHEGRGC